MDPIIGTVTSFASGAVNWNQAGIVVDEGHNCLWVGILCNRWEAGTRYVDSLTYDGDAMTLDGFETYSDEDMWWQWWYKFNPPVGSYALQASTIGTGVFTNVVHAVSLARINTSVAPRTPVGQGGSRASVSAAITTEVGDIVMAIGGPNADKTIVASSGSTEIAELYGTSDDGNADGWAGYRRAANGVSTTIGCEWAGATFTAFGANAFAVLGLGSQAILVA